MNKYQFQRRYSSSTILFSESNPDFPILSNCLMYCSLKLCCVERSGCLTVLSIFSLPNGSLPLAESSLPYFFLRSDVGSLSALSTESSKSSLNKGDLNGSASSSPA